MINYVHWTFIIWLHISLAENYNANKSQRAKFVSLLPRPCKHIKLCLDFEFFAETKTFVGSITVKVKSTVSYKIIR